MAWVVRAFPVIRPVDELKAFLALLLHQKREETDAFYKSYGVSHESAYLQETAHGPLLIVVTAVDDPGNAAPQYKANTQAFDAWFKSKVHYFTGIDPNETPLGPPTTEVYSWSKG